MLTACSRALEAPRCRLGTARYRAAAHPASTAQPREDETVDSVPVGIGVSKPDAPVRPERFSKYGPSAPRTHQFRSTPNRVSPLSSFGPNHEPSPARQAALLDGTEATQRGVQVALGVRHAALWGDTLVRSRLPPGLGRWWCRRQRRSGRCALPLPSFRSVNPRRRGDAPPESSEKAAAIASSGGPPINSVSYLVSSSSSLPVIGIASTSARPWCLRADRSRSKFGELATWITAGTPAPDVTRK